MLLHFEKKGYIYLGLIVRGDKGFDYDFKDSKNKKRDFIVITSDVLFQFD